MYIPDAFFSSELFWSSLKWLMIFGVWGVFAYGTWRENRKLHQMLVDKIESGNVAVLLRTLHRRDMQIWVQVSLLLVVVAVNDIRYDAALLPKDFFALPVTPPTPAPVPVANENPNDRYDKAIKSSSSLGVPFSNITEFNEQNSKQEAYIDWLKERYESWLVTYSFLKKCNQVGANDYDTIRHSLRKELGAAHADQSVESNILIAADGSYNEMYSDIPCDSAHIATTKSQYDANMQQMRSEIPKTSANPDPASGSKPGNTH